MTKKVLYSAEESVLGMRCFECGSAKIGHDPHGIKFCKECGIVVEEWMNE